MVLSKWWPGALRYTTGLCKRIADLSHLKSNLAAYKYTSDLNIAQCWSVHGVAEHRQAAFKHQIHTDFEERPKYNS